MIEYPILINNENCQIYAGHQCNRRMIFPFSDDSVLALDSLLSKKDCVQKVHKRVQKNDTCECRKERRHTMCSNMHTKCVGTRVTEMANVGRSLGL